MKNVLFLTLALSVFALPASSSLLMVSDPSVTMNGPSDYTWTYEVYLDANSRLNPPGGPCTQAIPGGVCDGLLTIYDFAGYIGGSIATTAVGWTMQSAQLIGITPLGLSPSDDPSILNLSWQYVGADTIQAPALSALLLGTFSARSLYSTPTNTDYAGRTAAGAASTRSANLDVTQAPTSVPEPAAIFLFGSGLLALAFSARRKPGS
jgi:PEP-CTERM motif